MLTHKETSLLERHEWEVDYYENKNSFSISHKDGSSIESCEQAFDYLIEALIEEEKSEEMTYSVDEILKRFGFFESCSSPFEIASIHDKRILVTGFAADVFFTRLRRQFYEENRI